MPVYRKHNPHFFKKWSRDMAYFLGFFCADGNIIKTKRGTHFISLYSADKTIIAGLREAIESEHKLSECISETGVTYKFQIGSKEMFYDLCTLGVIPNKTNRMKVPNIPPEFEEDFIRGYFDGDGNVWNGVIHRERAFPTKVLQASFTSCSKDFLLNLLLILRSRGISGGYIYTHKYKNYSRLTIGTSDTLKLYKIMYNKPHKLFLNRKKLVFEKFAAVAQR